MQVGNPITNDYYDYKGILEYAWSHSVISDQEYDKARKACNFKLANWTDGCENAMSVVFNHYEEIDIYNIYAPSCRLNNTSSYTGTKVLYRIFHIIYILVVSNVLFVTFREC